MKKLQCELCGSIDIVKTSDNLFVCQHCGFKYTKNQAMAMVQGTVEIYSGNKEFQRKLKAAKTLSDLGDYTNAFIAFDNLTKEYAYEPDCWKEFCFATLTKIRKTKTIETSITIHQKPIHSFSLKEIYDRALHLAPANSELQSQWDTFWTDAAKKLECGQYIINCFSFLIKETVSTLSSFHPAMKAIMNVALANAQALNNNCIEYRASRLNSNEFEWLPSRKNSNPVSYALGLQICTHDLLLLSMPISCTDSAIIEYQAKASANARRYYNQNTCPYCGGTLNSKLLGKECYLCGKIKRP